MHKCMNLVSVQQDFTQNQVKMFLILPILTKKIPFITFKSAVRNFCYNFSCHTFLMESHSLKTQAEESELTVAAYLCAISSCTVIFLPPGDTPSPSPSVHSCCSNVGNRRSRSSSAPPRNSVSSPSSSLPANIAQCKNAMLRLLSLAPYCTLL